MPRVRSKKSNRALREVNQAQFVREEKGLSEVKQSLPNVGDKASNQTKDVESRSESALNDEENCDPQMAIGARLESNTAELYNELDTFRLKWKRELEENKKPETVPCSSSGEQKAREEQQHIEGAVRQVVDVRTSSSKASQQATCEAEEGSSVNDETYAKAKKLFLMAVELEQDDMPHESIRYYKQAIHLCPDIEKQIFQEQRLISVQETNERLSREPEKQRTSDKALLDRIKEEHQKDAKDNNYQICRPAHKVKASSLHISDLPHELILNIYRYVIGTELDLASLETLGSVCRGFFILSRDQGLWRSICQRAYGEEIKNRYKESENSVDWRTVFLEKPRVNYDGVYISRTRYIRQGDVGFQDLTYRPFHVIRYYRYLRFFPDKRVLILTTNEEPDRIVPIFRHALYKRQFSSELSIIEGTYEISNDSQISIVAEKDFKNITVSSHQARRHEQLYWSLQTPQLQKFILKFKLDTIASRPYRNNALKWLEYTILARFDTGQEVTSFDLTPDTFPNLSFARVKKFNLKLTNPLPSH